MPRKKVKKKFFFNCLHALVFFFILDSHVLNGSQMFWFCTHIRAIGSYCHNPKIAAARFSRYKYNVHVCSCNLYSHSNRRVLLTSTIYTFYGFYWRQFCIDRKKSTLQWRNCHLPYLFFRCSLLANVHQQSNLCCRLKSAILQSYTYKYFSKCCKNRQ